MAPSSKGSHRYCRIDLLILFLWESAYILDLMILGGEQRTDITGTEGHRASGLSLGLHYLD